MSPDNAKKISDGVYKILLSDDFKDKFTGKIILNVQSGGVAGQPELEVTASGKVKLN